MLCIGGARRLCGPVPVRRHRQHQPGRRQRAAAARPRRRLHAAPGARARADMLPYDPAPPWLKLRLNSLPVAGHMTVSGISWMIVQLDA